VYVSEEDSGLKTTLILFQPRNEARIELIIRVQSRVTNADILGRIEADERKLTLV
jgi:hypothetical protein